MSEQFFIDGVDDSLAITGEESRTLQKYRVQLSVHALLPWMVGGGIAMGQALLATRCTMTTLGKCVGCGSCIVAVASLSSWAMKRRKADAIRTRQLGLEPFEFQ